MLTNSELEHCRNAWRGRLDTSSLEAGIRMLAYKRIFQVNPDTPIPEAKKMVDETIAKIKERRPNEILDESL